MDTNCLEAFSDGVFAIAITVLVLEIKVLPPNTVLGVKFLQLWPSYLAYVVSFLTIGAIWGVFSCQRAGGNSSGQNIHQNDIQNISG